MSRIRLIHITPELPPAVGGLADYTAILSRRIVELSNGGIEPVLVHAGVQATEKIDVGFAFVNLSGDCSASSLAAAVDRLDENTEYQTVILLEYSGYGFAKRGAPLWLCRGLERVCGPDGVPLITMAHEVRASGPIWTSAFWLSPVQLYVARRIAELSSGIMTTHPTGADQLSGSAGKETPVNVCPVFSNVGEPDERPSWTERAARAVIFGGDRIKRALYQTHRDETQACLNRWKIETVVDVGPSEASRPEALTTNVEVRGVQPAAAISQLLLNSRVGLLQYPAAHATKSGILAAYMAHGAMPILIRGEPLGGRLEPGTHFALYPRSEGTMNDANHISQTAAVWYDRHAHSRRAAETLRDIINAAMCHAQPDQSASL